MSWQEELRRLDTELAQGGITSEQHRKQREEVLAEASGVPGRPATAPPTAPSTSNTSDVSKRPRPQENEGSQGSGVSGGSGGPGGAPALLETTVPTTAPSPADERATDSMPYPDPKAQTAAELTMPITKVPSSAAPATPKPPRPSTPTERQGGRRPALLVALGVFVALAVVIGGAWWFGVLGEQSTRGHAQAGSQPSEPAQVALEDRLPTLPGRPSPENSTMSVGRGVELGLYPASQAEAMRESGAREVVYRSSAEGPELTDGYTVLVVPTPSARQAGELTDALTRSVTAEGFEASPLPGEPGVTALTRGDSASRVSVVYYVSGDNAVGVGVSQSAQQDESQLRQRLRDTLSSVESALPAS